MKLVLMRLKEKNMSEQSKMSYRKSGFVAVAEYSGTEYGCFGFRSIPEMQTFLDDPESFKADLKITIL